MRLSFVEWFWHFSFLTRNMVIIINLVSQRTGSKFCSGQLSGTEKFIEVSFLCNRFQSRRRINISNVLEIMSWRNFCEEKRLSY
jgi:hypothetical protein